MSFSKFSFPIWDINLSNCFILIITAVSFIGDVINLNDLPLFIESYPYKHKYQKKTLDEINKKISRKVSKITKEEHIEKEEYNEACCSYGEAGRRQVSPW